MDTRRPSTTTTTSTTTSTTTTPAAPPLRKVLLLGDSEMVDMSPYVTDGLGAAGIETHTRAFSGTSLLGGTIITQDYPAIVAEQQPDVVIVLFAGVYLPPYSQTADGQEILLGTPEFWQAWRDSAAQATRDLSVHAERVYWVLLPHTQTSWAAQDTGLNDAYLSLGSMFTN